ncbi:hypothetical protein D1P53_005326 [Cryptococcus gattii VGV]|nr:hypothetical protein D1P53_005326 [Cryptococcus gattii VGV]
MSSPPPVHPRRPKPKRLSLSLPLSPESAPSPALPRPPGPRRPSLLTLITQPPAAYPPRAPASPSSSSPTASTSTTPTTSPPLPPTFTLAVPAAYPFRQTEPYQHGPVQVLPGIWLGAEESVTRWDVWAANTTGNRVRVMNVAQEVEDPFDPGLSRVSGWSAPSGLPDEMPRPKLKLKTYPTAAVAVGDGARPIPHVEYCHARWSHGELGLADLPEDACLRDVLYPRAPESSERPWRFWETIRWMEEGRQRGIPILIHCQCGVSRSATLAIAYTMALAAAGAMPHYLGHIRVMQDAYDFVKGKSCWIGPNHSLVFQLVDFARSLTTLLSSHYATTPNALIKTSFPTAAESELSEAEWARRRREFDEDDMGEYTTDLSTTASNGQTAAESCMSAEEAGEEARRLDAAMLARREAAIKEQM